MIHFRHVFTLLFAVKTLCWPGHWPASNAFLHMTHLKVFVSLNCDCFFLIILLYRERLYVRSAKFSSLYGEYRYIEDR